MYVCVCNALTEDNIKEYVSLGCKSPRDIFNYVNSHAKCKTCVKPMKKVIDEYKRIQERT